MHSPISSIFTSSSLTTEENQSLICLMDEFNSNYLSVKCIIRRHLSTSLARQSCLHPQNSPNFRSDYQQINPKVDQRKSAHTFPPWLMPPSLTKPCLILISVCAELLWNPFFIIICFLLSGGGKCVKWINFLCVYVYTRSEWDKMYTWENGKCE